MTIKLRMIQHMAQPTIRNPSGNFCITKMVMHIINTIRPVKAYGLFLKVQHILLMTLVMETEVKKRGLRHIHIHKTNNKYNKYKFRKYHRLNHHQLNGEKVNINHMNKHPRQR